MMRAVRLKVLVLVSVSAVTLSVAFSNCAPKNNFGLTEQGEQERQGIFTFEAAFNPTSASKVPVDVIWVIDNSGSMANEAAHVRTNFERFASRLSAETDFRLALISRAGSDGTNVSLPYSGANYKQWNQSVSSTNALSQVATAFSDGGELASFLRPNSKKVVIAVTDDESAMSSDAFRTAFAAHYPSTQLAVFGFIGKVKGGSCSISKVGTVYETLAGLTGGATYDICETTWNATFDHLADSVIAITQNSIVLPETERPIIGIYEAYLNDVPVKPADYSLDGRTLRFNASLLAGLTQARVKILYRVQMPE